MRPVLNWLTGPSQKEELHQDKHHSGILPLKMLVLCLIKYNKFKNHHRFAYYEIKNQLQQEEKC